MSLTTRCLMLLILLLASTEKMVPAGRLHIRSFQFHLKEHWRYPQLLDSLLPWTGNLFSTPRMVAESHKHDKRHRPSSQDHSIQLFTDTSNEGWGTHLQYTSTKGLWSDRVIRLLINVLELKMVSLALQRFKDRVKPKQCWLLQTTQQ